MFGVERINQVQSTALNSKYSTFNEDKLNRRTSDRPRQPTGLQSHQSPSNAHTTVSLHSECS